MNIPKRTTFRLRPPTLNDIPAAVAMLNACWLESVGTAGFSEATMRTNWNSPGFDYHRDVRLAVENDQIIGYCAVHCTPPFVRTFLMPRTHPAHRGRGIGVALTQWAEARVAENLPLTPAGTRVSVGCTNFSTHEPGAALLRNLGYQHIRSGYEMKIEMASAPHPPCWPNGITVQSMIADQEEEAVFRALDEAFQDHWGHVDRPLAESFAQWLHYIRHVPDYDPNLFFVARAGDQIAGVALCFPKDNDFPDMAWVEALGVRRPWRRQGVALALLQHLFGECYRRGIDKVGLGVDANSLTGATRLYEKVGMRIFRQWDTYEKELRAGVDLATQQIQNDFTEIQL